MINRISYKLIKQYLCKKQECKYSKEEEEEEEVDGIICLIVFFTSYMAHIRCGLDGPEKSINGRRHLCIQIQHIFIQISLSKNCICRLSTEIGEKMRGINQPEKKNENKSIKICRINGKLYLTYFLTVHNF